MWENIAIIISFLALLVGIIGNTWDKRKRGIKKITITGWITIVIGLSASVLGVVKNIHTQQELDWQNNQKKNIQIIAYDNLDNAVISRIGMFFMLSEQSKKTYLPKDYKSKDTLFPFLEDFKDDLFLRSLDYIKLSDSTGALGYDTTLEEYIKNNTTTFHNKLNELWNKFSLYYEVETIQDIDSILKANVVYFDNVNAVRGRAPYITPVVSHLILTGNTFKQILIRHVCLLRKIHEICFNRRMRRE